MEEALLKEQQNVDFLSTKMDIVHLERGLAKLEVKFSEEISNVWKEISNVEIKLSDKISDVEIRLSKEISDVEIKLSKEISNVEIKLSKEISDVRKEVSSVETRLSDKISEVQTTQKEQFKWFIAAFIGMFSTTIKN